MPCIAVRPAASLLTMFAVACGPSAGSGDDDDDDDGAGSSTDAGPTDAGASGGDGGGDPIENAAVYAHTARALYKVHPQTYAITMVGNFTWPNGVDDMTDIAIDRDGVMVGISYRKVYRVDVQTAACTLLSASLAGMFNGLSFVPSQLAFGTAGPDVLVGTRNTDGRVFQINPANGQATQIGDMGGGRVSSGDIVAITGFGMLATVPTGTFGPDQLVRLAPTTFAATPVGASTGFEDLWGVGFWGGRVFGFTDLGELAIIDSATGAGTRVSMGGEEWWGAAVTTAAPVID